VPDTNTVGASDGDRVYRAIKARAIAFAFNPGEPIRLNPLADSLGVSTTPIRAALNMLVAEGLVRREPQKGFIAMGLSEERFRGLYSLNQLLLEAALTARTPGRRRVDTIMPVVTDIASKLDDATGLNAREFASLTGELFLQIAELSGNTNMVEAVERINDSLNFVRVLECREPGAVSRELLTICELLLMESFDETARALAAYHRRRQTVTPRLLATLNQ